MHFCNHLFAIIKMAELQLNFDCVSNILEFLNNNISDLVSAFLVPNIVWQSAAVDIIRRKHNIVWHIQLHKYYGDEIIDIYTSDNAPSNQLSVTLPARSAEAYILLTAIFDKAYFLKGKVDLLDDRTICDNTLQSVFHIFAHAQCQCPM